MRTLLDIQQKLARRRERFNKAFSDCPISNTFTSIHSLEYSRVAYTQYNTNEIVVFRATTKDVDFTFIKTYLYVILQNFILLITFSHLIGI